MAIATITYQRGIQAYRVEAKVLSALHSHLHTWHTYHTAKSVCLRINATLIVHLIEISVTIHIRTLTIA